MDNMSQPGSPAARQVHRRSMGSIKSPRSSSRMSLSSSRHSMAAPAGRTASRASDEDSKTAVKVAIRVRPPLKPSDPGFDLIPQRFRASTCEIPSPTNLVVASPQGKKLFVFDRVFDEDVTQEGVWSYLSDSVNSFVQGYNVSILAYGQSGAGKSYTMGTNGEQGLDAHSGVIPRAAQALFEKLQGPALPKTGLKSPARYSSHGLSGATGLHKSQPSVDKGWQLTATYVEIYNEQLRDLLVPETVPQAERAPVSIREDTKGRILLTGLTSMPVNSVDDLLHALHFGSAIRQTDSTNINEKSSRSHAVFSLNLVQHKTGFSQPRDKRMSVPLEAMSNPEFTVSTDSKLHFVDLAGSERLKNTGAQGERAREGISINAGLASLGKVISQLSSRQPGGYVSYRDSRLTRLLQDSLGGNAITYMVACVTPAEFHLSETLNTVTYAQRARAIQSKPEIQQAHEEKDNGAKVERLQAEIAFLRDQIKHERSNEQTPTRANGARPGGRHESEELESRLMDMQQSYNALSQRHSKLIAEISRARDNQDEDMPTVRETIGDSALDRLKRSNSLSEAVEQVVEEYEKTIQSLEASLSNTRSTLSNNEEILMERESKIAFMENLAQQLQSRLSKASDREANNDAYLRDLETQIEGATSSEEKSASLIASLRKEINRVKENETNTEEYIATLEERLAEAEQDQEIMQREIDRLEHVIERQRSIGRLDNLLSELDGIRKNEIDAKTGLRKTNGHDLEANPTQAFGDEGTVSTGDMMRGQDETAQAEQESPSHGEAVPDDDGVEYAEDAEQVNDNHNGHPIVSITEPSRPVTQDDHQVAQSSFMADKLETVTQELFDLRGEHESTIQEKEELQRKYEHVLQTLAKLQDPDSADEGQQTLAEDSRRQSFLGHAGVNLNGSMGDGQEPTSSSRSLGSGLLSSRQGTPSLAEELDKSREMSTDGDFEEEEEDDAEAGDVIEDHDDDVDPAQIALPEEDELEGELESLRQMHLEQNKRVQELSLEYALLQQHHQETLGQVESLKAEVSKSYLSLRPSSPSMRSPTLRRKLSQDLVATMTSTDKTTRSFASLRNIALDNFEKNIDLRQGFELNLNNIMTELYDQRQKVEALDNEMQTSRRELENKQQIITGLTRERSSLQATGGMDLTVVGQMQSQLENSEQQLRALQEAHEEKEKEWQSKLEELKSELDQHKAAVAYKTAITPKDGEQLKEFDAAQPSPTASEAGHMSEISRLERELAGWEAKHNDSLKSMKASEASLLATIAALEASRVEADRSIRDNDARHYEATAIFEQERSKHQETVAELQKQIETHRSAGQAHAEQLSRLEMSYSMITQQVDEQSKAKELTEKELQTHRNLVSNLESQIQSHKASVATHEANLENILRNLKDSHADEVNGLREHALLAEKAASDKHAALVLEHADALRILEEQHQSALSSLRADIERKQEDIDELLGSASTLLGYDTDVGRFSGHLSDALSRANANASVSPESEAVQAELLTVQAKCTDLENRVAELMVLNEETLLNLEQVKQKELKSSRLVQELEEQITNNYDQHQDATKRLSQMQERQIQLEEAYNAKNEMEKELEDARLKISLLESQLVDVRRRSLASTSRDSFTRDSAMVAQSPTFNRDSLSPEAAAIALAHSSSAGSLNTSAARPRSTNNTHPSTALPSPPPAIPLPPLPNSPQLRSASPTFHNTSIDARAASPALEHSRSPPGTPKSSYPAPTSHWTTLPPQQQVQQAHHPSAVDTSAALQSKIDEQDSRIRTIEKHLFAEKQLTATLEEALVDLESSQTKSKHDSDAWRKRCKELEDELVSLRKERTSSVASLQQVEEEREMRVRAERARMALEERMRELNSGSGGLGGKKKKKGALNCF